MSSIVVELEVQPKLAEPELVAKPSHSLKGLLALLDQVIVSGTNFLTVVILGRLSGKDELGIYALGFTLLVLSTALVDSLVIAPFVVFRQQMEGWKRTEYKGSILVQQGMWTLIAMSLLAAIVLSMTHDLGGESWIIAAILPATLLREFCRRLAFAMMRNQRALIMDMTLSALQLLALLSLGFTHHLTAFSAYTAIGCISAMVAGGFLILNRRDFVVRWNRVISDLTRHWAFGRWIAAGQMLGVVHGYIVHWILGITIGAEATGVYAACLAIAMLSNPLFLAMSNILGPRTALARREGFAPLRREVRNSSGVLLMSMGLFVCVIFLFGRFLMQFVYGTDFADDQAILGLLALAIFAGGPGMAADHGLRALEKPVYAFVGSLSGLIVTTTLGVIFAHSWGIAGAALGYLLGTVTSTSIRWIAFMRLSLLLLKPSTEGDE